MQRFIRNKIVVLDSLFSVSLLETNFHHFGPHSRLSPFGDDFVIVKSSQRYLPSDVIRCSSRGAALSRKKNLMVILELRLNAQFLLQNPELIARPKGGVSASFHTSEQKSVHRKLRCSTAGHDVGNLEGAWKHRNHLLHTTLSEITEGHSRNEEFQVLECNCRHLFYINFGSLFS